MPKILKMFAEESKSDLVVVNAKRLKTFLNRKGKDISSYALSKSLYRHQGYKGLKVYNRTSKGIDYCLRKTDIIEVEESY